MSRWQRDLSDSTALRNVGLGIGHSVLAIRSTLRGLGKLAVDADRIGADLSATHAVLAEAVQTVMRRFGIDEPYEKLKSLTRGQQITADGLQRFIETLEIPEKDRQVLLELTPDRYIGLAAELAHRFSKG